MANFTITVSNSMNLFGGSPSSKWAEWNWNAFKWGEGTADLAVAITHLISEALILDSSVPSRDAAFVLQNSLSLDTGIDETYLTDGSGYNYVFPSNVTNHEDQTIPSYTVGNTPSNAWSSGTVGSVIWS